jgi:hypothetical protein
MDAAATTQAIARGDGGADQTAMLGGPVAADRATRYADYAEPEEERRTSVGWVVVSLLALVVVGLAAFFITRAVTGDGTGTVTTLAPSTVPPTAPPSTAETTQPTTTEPKPTQPTPTQPKPTEPTPTQPKPTEPTPTQTTPTEPTPTPTS